MKTSLLIFICVVLIMPNIALAKKRLVLEKEVSIIASKITEKMKKGNIVAISYFTDLDNRITYFGKYLSNRISTELANNPKISVVERTEYEKILQEFKLQQSGLFDNETIIEMGKLVGANTIIFGTVSELKKTIDVNLKIMNVKKGTIIGGVIHAISKTSEISSLVGSIVRSEKEKEADLALQRQKVLAFIEVEKQKSLRAIEQDEKEMRKKLVVLEKKLRNESKVIQKYEAKKTELEIKKAYSNKLLAEMDNTSSLARKYVRIGMTFDQVKKLLDGQLRWFSSRRYIAGRYVFTFEGGTVTDVYNISPPPYKLYWFKLTD